MMYGTWFQKSLALWDIKKKCVPKIVQHQILCENGFQYCFHIHTRNIINEGLKMISEQHSLTQVLWKEKRIFELIFIVRDFENTSLNFTYIRSRKFLSPLPPPLGYHTCKIGCFFGSYRAYKLYKNSIGISVVTSVRGPLIQFWYQFAVKIRNVAPEVWANIKNVIK